MHMNKYIAWNNLIELKQVTESNSQYTQYTRNKYKMKNHIHHI